MAWGLARKLEAIINLLIMLEISIINLMQKLMGAVTIVADFMKYK
jgi:hypothetical protein